MDTITLCGWSAFQWHRIPPLVRMLHLSGIEEGASALPDDPSLPLLGGIDRPLHVLAADDAHRPRAAGIKPLVHSLLPPKTSLIPICDGLFVTNVAYTALTLARSLSTARLALAISELLGSFAVFKPPFELQIVLDQIAAGNVSEFGDLGGDLLFESLRGWQQARNLKGQPTDLWQRPALTSLEQLRQFAYDLPHRTRGAQRLKDALAIAVEAAASPLEVEAALLLGLPRRKGGEGLGAATCNKMITLSPEAKRIAGKSVCYADLFFTAPRKQTRARALDIECQSVAWHDGTEKTLDDNARATALQCMGLNVMFLTKRQLEDDELAAEIAREARSRLKVNAPEPGAALLEQRAKLRREVIVDWKTFGMG